MIGSRVHPRTGVVITYVAAVPLAETVVVAAGEELIKVRWVGWPEAGDLMGGMHEPVREYLQKVAGPSEGAGSRKA